MKNQEEMGKHELDSLFSDKLKEFESLPQAVSWDKIEEELDKSTRKSVWPWVGIAASALLAMFSYWYYLDSQEPMNSLQYAYTDETSIEASVQTRILLLPVIIESQPSQFTETKTVREVKSTVSKEDSELLPFDQEEKVTIALVDTEVIEETTNPEVSDIASPETIVEESIVIASNDEINTETETESDLAPLTIIYKQGEKEEKTNFEKAYAYIGEVSRGEKKLLDFRKLGDNIKSKFNSK